MTPGAAPRLGVGSLSGAGIREPGATWSTGAHKSQISAAPYSGSAPRSARSLRRDSLMDGDGGLFLPAVNTEVRALTE